MLHHLCCVKFNSVIHMLFVLLPKLDFFLFINMHICPTAVLKINTCGNFEVTYTVCHDYILMDMQQCFFGCPFWKFNNFFLALRLPFWAFKFMCLEGWFINCKYPISGFVESLIILNEGFCVFVSPFRLILRLYLEIGCDWFHFF